MDLDKAMKDLDFKMGMKSTERKDLTDSTGFFESSMSPSKQFLLNNIKGKKKEKEAEPEDGKKTKQYMIKKKTYVDYKGIEVEKEAYETKVLVKANHWQKESDQRKSELSLKMFSEGIREEAQEELGEISLQKYNS